MKSTLATASVESWREIDVDVHVVVPVENALGATYAELTYRLELTLDIEGEGIEAVVQAPLELMVGSQLVPIAVEFLLSEMIASNGLIAVRTRPIVLEPPAPLERLELDTAPTTTTGEPRPRRVVTIPR